MTSFGFREGSIGVVCFKSQLLVCRIVSVRILNGTVIVPVTKQYLVSALAFFCARKWCDVRGFHRRYGNDDWRGRG
jgi:hypothetical protein